jgi:hypothetical protein
MDRSFDCIVHVDQQPCGDPNGRVQRFRNPPSVQRLAWEI